MWKQGTFCVLLSPGIAIPLVQSSGLAVAYKEGELEHAYLKRFLSGNRRSRSKQQTGVNFLESSEPTAHVQ